MMLLKRHPLVAYTSKIHPTPAKFKYTSIRFYYTCALSCKKQDIRLSKVASTLKAYENLPVKDRIRKCKKIGNQYPEQWEESSLFSSANTYTKARSSGAYVWLTFDTDEVDECADEAKTSSDDEIWSDDVLPQEDGKEHCFAWAIKSSSLPNANEINQCERVPAKCRSVCLFVFKATCDWRQSLDWWKRQVQLLKRATHKQSG